ncbi:MAG: DNA lyase [Verrucomicrobia bacterium]|nr:DNA lyase [Verrucomicrobiota bacterium]
MRLWTLHPQYLDAKGLVALWREALLAQKVLQGATRGYRHHPQLHRFRQQRDPVAVVGVYLRGVAEQARQRGYKFDETKIISSGRATNMAATRGQLRYEWEHLKKKLRVRDRAKFRETRSIESPEPHPLFTIVPGEIEPWEIRP